jgi:hypothetical protein
MYSEFGYFGDDAEDWLAFIFRVYPKDTLLERTAPQEST